MDDIRENTTLQIKILEISAFNGKGLTEVIDWIQQSSPQSWWKYILENNLFIIYLSAYTREY